MDPRTTQLGTQAVESSQLGVVRKGLKCPVSPREQRMATISKPMPSNASTHQRAFGRLGTAQVRLRRIGYDGIVALERDGAPDCPSVRDGKAHHLRTWHSKILRVTTCVREGRTKVDIRSCIRISRTCSWSSTRRLVGALTRLSLFQCVCGKDGGHLRG